MVLRCSRGKKWIKNGTKLDKKISKTVVWSFSDTFLTYFWLICWGTLQAFIWDQLHWSEVVSRYSRGKKRIKKGLKLDKKVSKTVIWSFSDTFFTYFWWILLRNITSFHLRPITLIWDGFEVFYGGKLIKKGPKIRQKIFKKL